MRVTMDCEFWYDQ